MVQKLTVGPVNNGLRTDRLPFVIDNDSFPILENAYQWRGRVKRKRGTTFIGQLSRWVGTTNGSGNLTVTLSPVPITAGQVHFTVGTDIFTDQGGASPVTLITNSSGSATLNRSTGVLTITGSQHATAVIYYPSLPVMGIEELNLNPQVPVETVSFDTDYSYLINTNAPFPINDVTYYKNPLTSGAGYVPKTTPTPFHWNGQDYQQFWTTNYQGALWATNGVTVPFSISNVGMQYASGSTVPPLTGATGLTATTASFTVVGNPLVVGDFVFTNEFTATKGINFQTGYVTTAGDTFTVTFPNATIAGGNLGIGMIQYLTNTAFPTQDCIKWFDGDPTNGAIPPTFNTGDGWVNYMPPLSEGTYSIGDLPAAQYYLVGAKMMIPFKDRILFLGPVIQTSSAGSQVYLPDTIIYSQNGTPYYTASYTNVPSATADTPTSIGTNFNPLIVPANQTATSPAMFEDQIGFGGFISAGVSDIIISLGKNEDALIVGFTKFQTRVLSTGSDVVPFEFFTVNSELGTASTFSSITLDQGVLSRGSRGYVMTNQTSAARFDLPILDEVFQINLSNNGNERFTSQRDFVNEWVYFTFNGTNGWRYPNQTLLYNYRDESFAIFYESYTTYGPFTQTNLEVWQDLTYFTWEDWNTPWNLVDNKAFQPQVLAGNQEGFIMRREDAITTEGTSLYIQNISGNTLTVANHNLNDGDFITISGALGTNVSAINGKVFQVANSSSSSPNTFNILPPPSVTITYQGGGMITRMYIPFIQTKQFPLAWSDGLKTRIGPQRYLLTKTNDGQITVQMYLSQDSANPYNKSFVENGSLTFSQLVYTCPESTNLGLTPFNTNLNMLIEPGSTAGAAASSGSQQIWHRMNTSLIGDTVQLGFTISDEQMYDPNIEIQFEEVELHGFIVDVSPSGQLA